MKRISLAIVWVESVFQFAHRHTRHTAHTHTQQTRKKRGGPFDVWGPFDVVVLCVWRCGGVGKKIPVTMYNSNKLIYT
jgi:hypothetical protein